MSLLSRLMALLQNLSEPSEERALAAMRRKARDSITSESPAEAPSGRWPTIERGSTAVPHEPPLVTAPQLETRPSPTYEPSSASIRPVTPPSPSPSHPLTSSPYSISPSSYSYDESSSTYRDDEPYAADDGTRTAGGEEEVTTASEGDAPTGEQQPLWSTQTSAGEDFVPLTTTLQPAVFPDVPYPSLSRGSGEMPGAVQQRGPRNMINFMVAEPTRRIAIHLSGGSALGVPHALPPGFPHSGSANLTAFMGPRGSMGNLAGSLHGGVNVLLGGAMLSGLILLVFLICYCCQRSARKNDSHFRTQYWLPDPDGPLEVFTLDAQAQRLFLPQESMEALMQQAQQQQQQQQQRVSPSPPPAYHTVCLKQEAPAAALAPAPGPVGLGCQDDAPVKSPPLSVICEDLDADGLPSYEAALKLEAQQHM